MNRFLPQSVRLPFGYIVTIKAIASRALRRHARDAYGCWDVHTRTIYVDATLTEPEQRYILTHEMGHAYVDWQHHALGDATEPRKP